MKFSIFIICLKFFYNIFERKIDIFIFFSFQKISKKMYRMLFIKNHDEKINIYSLPDCYILRFLHIYEKIRLKTLLNIPGL